MSVGWLLAGVIVGQAVLLWAIAGRLESRWAQATLAGGVGFLYSAFVLHLPPSLTTWQRVLVIGVAVLAGIALHAVAASGRRSVRRHRQPTD